jgi:hypothetical protein
MASSGADIETAPAAGAVYLSLLPVSLFITTFIKSDFGFGEEFGWRGYLLHWKYN